MTTRPLLAMGAVATALTLTLTACGGDNEPTANTTPTETTPPITAPPHTPTPTPTTPEQQALHIGTTTILTYYETVDLLLSDHSQPISDLANVASIPILQRDIDSVENARSAGRTRTGGSEVSDFEFIYANFYPEQPVDGIAPPQIIVRACLDRRAIKITPSPTPQPASIIAEKLYMEYSLLDVGFPGDAQWRVSEAEPQVLNGDPTEPVPCP